jgi:hypothetical protein
MPSRILLILPLATSVVFLVPQAVLADDGAASIAAGGLVPRREVRIVMEKEVLSISEKRVVVDYDFRNGSAEDVITEVAFPVPPYKDDIEAPTVSLQSFSDFRLFVNDGKPAAFNIEAKATLKMPIILTSRPSGTGRVPPVQVANPESAIWSVCQK